MVLVEQYKLQKFAEPALCQLHWYTMTSATNVKAKPTSPSAQPPAGQRMTLILPCNKLESERLASAIQSRIKDCGLVDLGCDNIWIHVAGRAAILHVPTPSCLRVSGDANAGS